MKELEGKIQARMARIGGVGLGYVGLPLAVELAKAGFSVVGLDTDADRVQRVSQADSYIDDVDEEDLREVIESRRLRTTTDWEVVPELDVLILCVPTSFNRNKEPDLSHVLDVTREIAARLRPGQLIVLESTTYPGTTEEAMLPLLESGGLRVGQGFSLAYAPERVDPGNRMFTVANIPRVVGGVTPRCTHLATTLYETIAIKVVSVSSTRVAEMAKLLENIFRNVNIALVNELAMLCDRMGIDIWEVIEAASSKPFGFTRFFPGPGVGGHCIPVDSVYLSWKAKQYDFFTNFITLAAEINANMPHFVAQKVVNTMIRRQCEVAGSTVLILGVAFKRDVSDVRNSSALKLIELLSGYGLRILFHDPFIPEISIGETRLESVPLTDDLLASSSCVIIHTDHSSYDYDWIVARASLVFDTRNATRSVRAGRENVVKL